MSEPRYVAFIDESGDPGLKRVRPIDPDGASEWLALGAVVVRAENEQKAVDWVRELRRSIGSVQGPDIHYKRLSVRQKLEACTIVSSLPIRSFVVLSHKTNMKGHRNYNVEKYAGPRGWFYNWCVRLLLERVTDFCAKDSQSKYGSTSKIKFLFSERGAVEYRWLSAYIELLSKQSKNSTSVLTKRLVHPDTISPDMIEVAPHSMSAGCQLSDIVVSAFYNAADTSGPRWNVEPASSLKRCVAKEGGFYHDYGLTLQPTPPWRANLNEKQKIIFERYGYNFRP